MTLGSAGRWGSSFKNADVQARPWRKHWRGSPPPKAAPPSCRLQDDFCGPLVPGVLATSQNLLKCRTPGPIRDTAAQEMEGQESAFQENIPSDSDAGNSQIILGGTLPSAKGKN